jgi:hypothetical protein
MYNLHYIEKMNSYFFHFQFVRIISLLNVFITMGYISTSTAATMPDIISRVVFVREITLISVKI